MKEMSHSWADDTKVPSRSNSVSSSEAVLPQFPAQSNPRHGRGNVFHLLASREISPRTKHSSKRLWGEASNSRISCFGPKSKVTDARQCLISWVEAESWRHLSAKYCSLVPPPRSTIAAAFSLDGKTLASTHGDHTVKIIDFQTGSCLKVLSGHRRTPWVVRFHPVHPEILASGSLDHEVRLWDANTADCIGSRNFYRPIASIAFHALGELLAVASGHKLYIWHYNRRGESSPTIVLKTRRSLRAVHFHPHGAPFLLTAEVNDLDSPDCPVTVATSPGYLHYPTPSVLYANGRSSVHPSLEAKVPLVPFPCLFWRTFVKDGGRTSLQHGNGAVGSSNGQQHDYFVPRMEVFPLVPSSSNPVPEDTMVNGVVGEMENAVSDSVGDAMETTEEHPLGGSQQSDPHRADAAGNLASTIFQVDQVSQIPIRQSRRGIEAMPTMYPSNLSEITDLQMPVRTVEVGQLHRYFAFDDPASWELPFLQGWLMGQTHAGLHPVLPINNAPQGHWFGNRGAVSDVLESDLLATGNVEVTNATCVGQSRGTGRSGSRHRSRSRFTAPTGPGDDAAFINTAHDDSDPQPSVGITESEIGTSLAATAAAELPCTVKLRLWPHDIQNPCVPLDAETCRLTVPHAVLCSEMGAHFSPCGRFLAACVACVLPHMEVDPGFQSQVHHDISGFATSPTRHPVSAHQVVYELRIYSLEEATFGSVLTSRAIRAAHCLTSIQFSPTSDHILLAYGRRHSSLLRSFVVDGETATPIYTNLEVYRVSDMELVGVIPSAEDEVNVACFHPLAGGGLVYGTKEGRLRILQYDGSRGISSTSANLFLEENMLEVQTYALEC